MIALAVCIMAIGSARRLAQFCSSQQEMGILGKAHREKSRTTSLSGREELERLHDEDSEVGCAAADGSNMIDTEVGKGMTHLNEEATHAAADALLAAAMLPEQTDQTAVGPFDSVEVSEIEPSNCDVSEMEASDSDDDAADCTLAALRSHPRNDDSPELPPLSMRHVLDAFNNGDIPSMASLPAANESLAIRNTSDSDDEDVSAGDRAAARYLSLASSLD